MSHSGDAAEQIVRMSLEGAEVALRITGSAAKETVLLILAAIRSRDKGNSGGLRLRGKERLDTMLKSGKPLEIFSVREIDLRGFADGAKEYGIVYCVLRNAKESPDGLCDIMVKADDAPKINRLVERLEFAKVDKAKIENEIVTEMATTEKQSQSPFVRSAIPRNQSELTSGGRKKPEKPSSSRMSVRGELKKIAAAQKKEAQTAGEAPTQRAKPESVKSVKMKGSR